MKKFIEFLLENEEIDINNVRKLLGHNNFEIIDGKVNVNCNVSIRNIGMHAIPVKFGIIKGYFTCSDNKLTSLKNCPDIVNENFYCIRNRLISLEGCPQIIYGNFDCSNNKLTSLKGGPQEVKRDFDCSDNQLTSLKGCPRIINGDFSCSSNQLTSLEGCPETINGDFNCNNNQLTSLKECPREINGNFNCSSNPLVDISDIVGKEIKEISCYFYKLNITIGNCKALKQINYINKVDWYLDTDSEEELQLHAINVNQENIKKIPKLVNNIIKRNKLF